MKNKNNSFTDLSAASPSAEEILSYLMKSGIVDLDGVAKEIMNERREKNLKNHPYAIGCGKDKRFRTYVNDPEKPSGRRMIAKSSLEKLKDALIEFYEGEEQLSAKNKVTLKSLFEDWMVYKSNFVADTTLSRIRRDWTRYYIEEELIDKPIRAITKIDLEVWLHNRIQDFEMNKHQYANFSLIINQMLEYAVDLGIIETNLFHKVKVNRRKDLKREHKKADYSQVYYADELSKLFQEAWSDYYKKGHKKHQLVGLAVMFMFWTGLRISEVCALRYEDIDNDISLIVRRMLRGETREVVDSTKGTYGDREIILVKEAKNLIHMAKERQCEENVSDKGFIFSMTDQPVPYWAVQKAFYSFCKKAGIEPKSSHKARKTYVSTLLASGVGLNTVRQLVGHRDERTTLGSYCYDTHNSKEIASMVSSALQDYCNDGFNNNDSLS